MAIRIDVDGQKIANQFGPRASRMSNDCIAALQAAAREASDRIEKRGRANMRGAGDFGSKRWQQGFQAFVSFASRASLRIRVTHAVSYWRVFQHGARIFGRPLLWIPLPFARDAQGVRARDYPGRLFRVNRLGKSPLLMTTGGKPKYFGRESVRIPKKFRLIEIAREVFRSMPAIYRAEKRKHTRGG